MIKGSDSDLLIDLKSNSLQIPEATSRELQFTLTACATMSTDTNECKTSQVIDLNVEIEIEQ